MNARDRALEALMEGSLASEQARLLLEESAKDPEFAQEYATALQVLSFEHALKHETVGPSSQFTDHVMRSLDSLDALPEAPSRFDRLLNSSFVDFLCDLISPRTLQWSVALSVLFLTGSVSFWAGTQLPPQLIPLPVAQVLVPRGDIPPGAVLTEAMFERRYEPLSALSDQSVLSPEELQGQVAAHLIVAGYALDRRYMRTDPSALPPGYRFVAVLLDEESEEVHRLRVGDSIQLVAAVRDSTGTMRAAQLARKAHVVRLEDAQDLGQRVAFVSVPAEEAARIDLAKREGTVLIMNNSNNFPA